MVVSTVTLAVAVGTTISVLLTLHAIINGLLLRRPEPAGSVSESVAVLIPCRNEAAQIPGLLDSLLGLRHLEHLEIHLLDDHSTDQTRSLISAGIAEHPHVFLHHGQTLPPGWSGKTFACHQLAQHATDADILVFIDADVRLSPDSVAQAVRTLRQRRLSLVSPYPRQISRTWSEHLMQPLLQWSWLATLPLRWAERSTRTSLSAANGQFLVVDGDAYRRSGGHLAISTEVLDDIRLLQSFKRHGYRGVVIDGSELATCRMYSSWTELQAGYSKWLWSALGPPISAALVVFALTLIYLVPPAAAIAGSSIGAVGYLAAVISRLVAAVRSGSRMRDALLHPLSIAMLILLIALSWRGRLRGTLAWKERTLR